MAFDNFNETGETKETPDKPRNQILETPDGFDAYDDGYENAMDEMDSREKESAQEAPEQKQPGPGSKIQEFVKKMVDSITGKKDAGKETDSHKEGGEGTEEAPGKSQREKFVESLQADPDENGAASEPAKRPDGGVQRERSLYGGDRSPMDTMDDPEVS